MFLICLVWCVERCQKGSVHDGGRPGGGVKSDQWKSIRACQPLGRVFKGTRRGALRGMELPDKKRLSFLSNVYLKGHTGVRRLGWMRLASRPSSRSRAMASVDGLARFARRSCIWRMNAAVARVPMQTEGSPFSRRHKVFRLTKSRDAMSAVEIPLFLWAIDKSRPSLLRA